jgi:glycosyltransferase involved in cell wall biosynthesis
MKNKTGKIKVVYVISRIDYALAFDWVEKYLDKSKYELHFIFLNPSVPKLHLDFIERGVYSHYICFNAKVQYPKVAFKLMRLLMNIKPDVMHAHLIDACLVSLPVAYLLGIKKRVYTRHHSTYHFDYFPNAVKYDRLINFLATDIIAISANVYNVLVNREGAKKDKVKIIHHGFELNRFSDINQANVDALKLKYNPIGKQPVVGVISRFTEWKGVQYIIPAFKKLLQDYPNALIILANAQGDMQDEINKQLSESLNGSFVTIKFEKDLYSLYKLFDVFVHVPIDESSEAFGQTYVEALAAGVPSVFTKSGIAAEFIEDKYNALVVDFKNTDSIYEALKLLLANADLKHSLITNGRNSVFSMFDVTKMIQSLEDLYAS